MVLKDLVQVTNHMQNLQEPSQDSLPITFPANNTSRQAHHTKGVLNAGKGAWCSQRQYAMPKHESATGALFCPYPR